MYAWVSKYVGIPFLSGGRDSNGVDCYGLVRLVLENEYGVVIPKNIGVYTNANDVCETKKIFDTYVPLLVGEKRATPREGFVCLIRSKGLLSHVGLFAGDNCIIHSKNGVGVVVERFDSPFLKGAIHGWYEICKS